MWNNFKEYFYNKHTDPLEFLGVNAAAVGNERFISKPIRITIFLIAHLFVTITMNLCVILTPTRNILIDLQTLCFAVQSILIWLKYFLLAISGKKSKLLRSTYNELLKEASNEEVLIIMQKLSFAKRFVKFEWTSALLISSYHTIPPLVSTLRAYFQETGENFRLPFPLLLFWNINDILGYLIAYTLTAIYVLTCFNSLAGVDYLFNWYMQACVGFHKILRLRIQHIATLLINSQHTDGDADVRLHDNWREIVHYHNRIKHIVNEINSFFNLMVLVHVILYLFILCLHAYLFVFSIEIVGQIVVAATGVFYLLNLVLYCTGGQLVINASSQTYTALYLSIPWEALTPKLKKTLYITLMCAQENEIINSLFFELDHPLLMWALKTTGSFTAALMAVRDR